MLGFSAELAELAGWGLSAGACPTLPHYPLGQGKQVRHPTTLLVWPVILHLKGHLHPGWAPRLAVVSGQKPRNSPAGIAWGSAQTASTVNTNKRTPHLYHHPTPFPVVYGPRLSFQGLCRHRATSWGLNKVQWKS